MHRFGEGAPRHRVKKKFTLCLYTLPEYNREHWMDSQSFHGVEEEGGNTLNSTPSPPLFTLNPMIVKNTDLRGLEAPRLEGSDPDRESMLNHSYY